MSIPFAKIRLFAPLLGLLWPALALAQDFRWEAPLDAPKADGFHQVELSPEMAGRLEPQAANLRWLAPEGTALPYIFFVEEALATRSAFVPYEIVSQQASGSTNRLVVRAPEGGPIESLTVQIRNADLRKTLKLSGSDDNKTFFALKNDYFFHTLPQSDGTSEIRIIDIPRSDYAYYELLFYDWPDNPLQILQVGHIDTRWEQGRYRDLPEPRVASRQEGSQSLFLLDYGQPVVLDRLRLRFSGATHFLRQATLWAGELGPAGDSLRRQVASLAVASSSDNDLSLDGVRAQWLELRLENLDNPPLRLDSAQARMLRRWVVAECAAGQACRLAFAAPGTPAPRYDLVHFSDSLRAELPRLSAQPLRALSAPPEPAPAEELPKAFIWLTLAAVGALLVGLSVKVLKDMGKKSAT